MKSVSNRSQNQRSVKSDQEAIVYAFEALFINLTVNCKDVLPRDSQVREKRSQNRYQHQAINSILWSIHICILIKARKKNCSKIPNTATETCRPWLCHDITAEIFSRLICKFNKYEEKNQSDFWLFLLTSSDTVTHVDLFPLLRANVLM